LKDIVGGTSAAASSALERGSQKQLIVLSKAVADAVFQLVTACKIAGSLTPEVLQQKMAEVSKVRVFVCYLFTWYLLSCQDASEAIKGLISTLKLGVAGSKDCDEAATQISSAIKQLDEPVPCMAYPFSCCKWLTISYLQYPPKHSNKVKMNSLLWRRHLLLLYRSWLMLPNWKLKIMYGKTIIIDGGVQSLLTLCIGTWT
jgi:hypothetical protein